jgi:outer membrane protein assembly factor BamB
MKKNLFAGAALLAVLFLVLFVEACVPRKKQPPTEVFAANAAPLVAPDALRPAGLQIAWTYNLPIKRREGLKNFQLSGDRLFTVSGRNFFVSLDRQNIRPAYSWQLAAPGVTYWGLEQYGDRIYSIIGTDLVALDPQQGTVTFSRPIDFGPICPPVRNKAFFYIAGTDQRVHALGADDFVQLFGVSANDDGQITTVVADDNIVAFATDAGTLAALLPDKPVQLWRFRATAAINAPLSWDSRQFIFSSEDAYVYALDAAKGHLIWKYLTPALLTDAPAVTSRYVYQHVSGYGLFALDRQTGAVAWKLPQGVGLLAENGRRVYLIVQNNKLIVYDNKNLKIISQVDIPGVTHWLSNTADAKIYLADDTGRIACIEPVKY